MIFGALILYALTKSSRVVTGFTHHSRAGTDRYCVRSPRGPTASGVGVPLHCEYRHRCPNPCGHSLIQVCAVWLGSRGSIRLINRLIRSLIPPGIVAPEDRPQLALVRCLFCGSRLSALTVPPAPCSVAPMARPSAGSCTACLPAKRTGYVWE